MKRKTESKSVRYGMSLRPSTKTNVIYVLVSFLLVIQVVKSVSAISVTDDVEFTTYDNRNFNNNNPTGEFRFFILLPFRFVVYYFNFYTYFTFHCLVLLVAN